MAARSSSRVDLRILHPRSRSLIWQPIKSRRFPDRKVCTHRDGLRTADIFPLSRLTQHDLVVFDLQTQKWTELARGSMGWLEWSKDGQYLQAHDSSGTGSIIRIRLSDHKTERVADLKNIATVGYYNHGLRSPPTIRRLCSATLAPRTFTLSTGKNPKRLTAPSSQGNVSCVLSQPISRAVKKKGS